MADPRTAFVSHYDCARHDTGWGHPDHQGRLPIVMRAVHADMLTLFGSLVEVEGRHATLTELESVHDTSYLEDVRRWVRDAEAAGSPIEVRPSLVVSGASWDASVAAVGCVLEGIDVVLRGAARNAFCAVRPAARDAGVMEPGRFGFLNQIGIAVRHLRQAEGVDRVLVVEWGGPPVEATASGSVSGGGVKVARLGLPEGASDDLSQGLAGRHAQRRLEDAVDGFSPDFVLLSASFDGLPADPLSGGSLSPGDYFTQTLAVRDLADSACAGRLVSVLEGGYSPGLGTTIVDHLRALAGVSAVAGG